MSTNIDNFFKGYDQIMQKSLRISKSSCGVFLNLSVNNGPRKKESRHIDNRHINIASKGGPERGGDREQSIPPIHKEKWKIIQNDKKI